MATNPNDYALVVGINDYPHHQKLNGAIRDAEDFAAWLRDRDTGGGLPDDNCKVVLSAANPLLPVQDTIDAVLDEIDEATRVQRGRRFYFYFSGHGLGERYLETALCLARWSQKWRDAALNVPAYCNLVAESGRFDELALFLDCCRVRIVNAAGKSPLIAWARPDDKAGATKTFIACATEFQNKAWEAATDAQPDEIRGFFTRALLSGLRGGAAVPPAGVPASELKKYIEKETRRLAEEKGKSQKPEVTDGFSAVDVPVFGSALPRTGVKVRISFNNRSGPIVLEDPELEIVRQDDATTGPWDLVLRPGQHVLRELDTGVEKAVPVRKHEESLNVTF